MRAARPLVGPLTSTQERLRPGSRLCVLPAIQSPERWPKIRPLIFGDSGGVVILRLSKNVMIILIIMTLYLFI